MNYLAHFHLAGHDEGFILGALLGDFIKGPLHGDALKTRLNLNALPRYSTAGIRLHRKIDAAFDAELRSSTFSNAFSKALGSMPEKSRRYAPIAFDLFFDYALSNYWQDYHSESLHQFSQRILQTLDTHKDELPAAARTLLQRLDRHALLINYGRQDFITRIGGSIGNRLAQRHARHAEAAEQIVLAMHHLLRDEEKYFAVFSEIYPKMQGFARSQRPLLASADKG